MKKACFAVSFLLFCQLSFSQDINRQDLISEDKFQTHIRKSEEEYMYLSKNQLLIDSIYSLEEERYDITWEIINKINYISFNYTGKALGPDVKNGNKRYLVVFNIKIENGMGDYFEIYSNFIAFYYHNNEMVFWMYKGNFFDFDEYDFWKNYYSITATSELQENKIVYSANNLMDLKHLFPWAECKPDDGKGVQIILTAGSFLRGNLILINGFIDYNRPYLF